MSDPIIEQIQWWADRLQMHHGDSVSTVEAQVIHLAGEVGEACKEWGEYQGFNPRKTPDNDSGTKFDDELADVAITALITLAVRNPEWWGLFRMKLNDTTFRLKVYDDNEWQRMIDEDETES